MDRCRWRPRQEFNPVVVLTAPYANLAPIAHFGHVEPATLIDAIARRQSLVADDDAVTAARRAADLVEGRVYGYVRVGGLQRRGDGDKACQLARRQPVGVPVEPCRPIRM